MTEPHLDPTAGAAEASTPGPAGADSADALAARALARERGRAWDAGQARRALSRQVADADGVAAWDRRRRLGPDAEGDGVDAADMDRGPGLPPGRDRPGPTRFDPRTGKQDLRRYAQRHGWASKLAMASVSVRWREIVGEQIADHAVIERFEPGRLTLRASSSAWAQQLRLLLPGIERQVSEALGEDGGAVEIRILGPAGPTWRHGRFGAARGGRGPRDTYG
ncbi:DUF721 domain-containing protein [Actinomyces ruminicola]|uniref:Uncharacterized protein n=1 Tax=Actinomyces ruminicola TaxID=332524 RepID=A0A1H0ABB9_9ACTO|nr:DciA family protein [Actinomyces ruminicola]SDN30584.1 Protein of unknown function [Actinomyces ruminicola]